MMTMSTPRAFSLGAALVLVLVVASTGGCAGLQDRDRANRLDLSSRAYTQSVRWGEFEAATAYLRHRDGSPVQPLDLDALRGIRVVGAEQVVAPLTAGSVEATMTASFTYHTADSNRLRSVTQRGVWWFDPDADRWWLDGRLPDFGP
jgi:hypothetical protein